MAREPTPTAEASPAVAFEVERFGWTASDRIEVTGRWFGLRGHRFMRPALIVESGDERRRLLALLEHKPWAADDGEPWTAAFGWEGPKVDVSGAELSVAPSVAVELPPPTPRGGRVRSPKGGGGGRTAGAGRTGPRIAAHGERRVETLERDLAAARAELEELRAERDSAARAARRETAALRAQVAEARARVRTLEEEADAETAAAAGAARDAAARAGAEAVAERDAIAAERDAAVTARDEAEQARDAAAAERDVAVDARVEAEQARDAAAAERDALAGELERERRRAAELGRERDSARADPPPAAVLSRPDRTAEIEESHRERDSALADRDSLLAERDEAREEAARERRALERRIEHAERRLADTQGERDAAVHERDAIRRERNDWISKVEAATAAREQARAERDKALRARDEAVAARDAAQAVAQASAFDRAAGATPLTPNDRRTRTGRPRDHAGRSALDVWAPRIFALAVLALIIVVVLTMLRGVL
jgi:hypothetical protein